MKAVGYCRVSTREQDDKGYSLPTQEQDITAYAHQNRMSLVEIIQEDASGSLIDRPGLNRARSMLRTGQVQAIIAHNSDRVSRHPLHYMQLREEWREQGSELHYALTGPVDLNDDIQGIMGDIRARIHRQELKTMIERLARGKRGKVRQGNIITGPRPPYGYRTTDDNELVTQEDEAAVVRQIFEWYTVDRLSIRQVTDRLTQVQIPTPGDKHLQINKSKPVGYWHRNTVRQILKRETYAGLWHWGKTSRKRVRNKAGGSYIRVDETDREKWIAVECPAIIPRETWETAQKLMTSNVDSARRNRQYDYLMRGRLTCGNCGLHIYGQRRSVKGRNWARRYYHCASKSFYVKRENCGMPYFRAIELDELAWQAVKNLLAEPDFMMRLIEQAIDEETAGQGDIEAQLAEKRGRLALKEAGLEKLLFLAEDANITAEALARRISGLSREIGEIQGEITELEGMLGQDRSDDLTALGTAIREYQDMLLLDDEPFEVRKLWVEALDVRGELRIVEGKRAIRLRCSIKPELFSGFFGTQLPKSYGHKIAITVCLPMLILGESPDRLYQM